MTSGIEAFTDGACRGNPGPGGWGAILRAKDTAGHVVKERTLSGSEPNTTNNRMELRAAIAALEALTRPTQLVLCTDSEYLKRGMTEWLDNWKRRGWQTAARQPVKNADLWQRLDRAARPHKIRWTWVRGHSGHPDNEAADALARAAIDALLAGGQSCKTKD